MNLNDPQGHFGKLREAYEKVGMLTWKETDFCEKNLDRSRGLFTNCSLKSREPEPKALEVIALLSGLPFGEEFVGKLINIQKSLSNLMGDCLHYWVKPENFGVEYCVFKWPQDNWESIQLENVMSTLSKIRAPKFEFSVVGVQINPDGCVVARGFDEGGTIFNIRDVLKGKLSSLPSRQSGWAHIPLGRILEPVGENRFAELQQLVRTIEDTLVASIEINKMLLVHESQWYMEKKEILAEYRLQSSNHEVILDDNS